MFECIGRNFVKEYYRFLVGAYDIKLRHLFSIFLDRLDAVHKHDNNNMYSFLKGFGKRNERNRKRNKRKSL